ncbi:hypothetical protein PCL_05302 [Purpureocillium lilacinum]|uniref:Uncharacterized protein n=1 Tax=Purpureocillium lilacinum TaxID=33203 RepID=A0A2U3DV33_PURLI|nr:hypothetical protein PCL_05302 [Purpureocillium lilacinum]
MTQRTVAVPDSRSGRVAVVHLQGSSVVMPRSGPSTVDAGPRARSPIAPCGTRPMRVAGNVSAISWRRSSRIQAFGRGILARMATFALPLGNLGCVLAAQGHSATSALQPPPLHGNPESPDVHQSQGKVPELISQESVEGASGAWGRLGGRQFRDGTLRLVTVSADIAVVMTVRSSTQPPLFETNRLSIPLKDLAEHHYVTPAGAGVAVSRRDSVSYHSRSGALEWIFRHDPWDDIGSGAWKYPGDRCILLESETGKVIDGKLLPSCSADYTLDGPLPQFSNFVLTAAQGQDDAYSWKVDVVDGCLHLIELASGMERVTGVQHNRILVQDLGGRWLQVRGVAPDGTMRIKSEMTFDESDVKSEDMSSEEDEEELFLNGNSGFVDDSHVIAAVAEEWCSEEADHFLLDAENLTIRSRIQYPFPVRSDPIALTDGTWVTIAGENVCRWRITQS